MALKKNTWVLALKKNSKSDAAPNTPASAVRASEDKAPKTPKSSTKASAKTPSKTPGKTPKTPKERKTPRAK